MPITDLPFDGMTISQGNEEVTLEADEPIYITMRVGRGKSQQTRTIQLQLGHSPMMISRQFMRLAEELRGNTSVHPGKRD